MKASRSGLVTIVMAKQVPLRTNNKVKLVSAMDMFHQLVIGHGNLSQSPGHREMETWLLFLLGWTCGVELCPNDLFLLPYLTFILTFTPVR